MSVGSKDKLRPLSRIARQVMIRVLNGVETSSKRPHKLLYDTYPELVSVLQ